MRCTRRSDHLARNARPVQFADPIFALISAQREHRRGGEQPTLRCSCRTLASPARSPQEASHRHLDQSRRRRTAGRRRILRRLQRSDASERNGPGGSRGRMISNTPSTHLIAAGGDDDTTRAVRKLDLPRRPGAADTRRSAPTPLAIMSTLRHRRSERAAVQQVSRRTFAQRINMSVWSDYRSEASLYVRYPIRHSAR